MKFRKKPVVIEAFEWRYAKNQEHLKWPAWLRAAIESGSANIQVDGSLFIETLEGTHRANLGDWIIQGVKGELYPCKPDIFAATYEAA